MEVTNLFRFIEYLIDDVVAANQYYNKKLESIKEEYSRLCISVHEDFGKVSSRGFQLKFVEKRFITQSKMGLYPLIKD